MTPLQIVKLAKLLPREVDGTESYVFSLPFIMWPEAGANSSLFAQTGLCGQQNRPALLLERKEKAFKGTLPNRPLLARTKTRLA